MSVDRRGHPFKVTFPAASIFGHPFTFKRGRDRRATSTLEEFVAHAIADRARRWWPTRSRPARGYIQFDFPLYPYLVDPAWVERFRERGPSIRQLCSTPRSPPTPRSWRASPTHVTTALHICRGNYRSSWMCEGSLEPVAEAVFGGLPVRLVPGGVGRPRPRRRVRAGSVPPPRLGDGDGPDQLQGARRWRTRTISCDGWRRQPRIAGGIDRLAISPQCGFACVMVGNDTDEDAQWRKLELVGRIADRLWPR